MCFSCRRAVPRSCVAVCRAVGCQRMLCKETCAPPDLEKAVSGVMPFALAYVVILLLFVAFPQIITAPLYWLAG